MRNALAGVLLAALAGCLVSGCGSKEPTKEMEPVTLTPTEEPVPPGEKPPPDWGIVVNGGFDGTEGWMKASARIADGKAILQRTGNYSFARLLQTLPHLEENARYVLSVRLSAESTPDDKVVADLTAEGYQSARRKLSVLPEEIGPEAITFEKVVPAETPPDSVVLRVFTRSTKPVVVDDVALVKLE
jgi:hypothetical protein